MKITISKEYRNHFKGGIVYIMRFWMKGKKALLLMNKEEKCKFYKAMEEQEEKPENHSFFRLVKAGVIETDIEID